MKIGENGLHSPKICTPHPPLDAFDMMFDISEIFEISLILNISDILEKSEVPGIQKLFQ